MTYWAIAQTHAQREGVAVEHLKRKGFEVYCPRIKVPSVVGRHRVMRDVPLFPCYLFVQVIEIWSPILSTVGVLRVLRNGKDEPSRIEAKIITRIQEQEIRGIVKLPKRLQRGDKVRITRGSFKDFIGVYDGMSGKERERVLLEMLGRKVPVDIHPDDFAALNVAP